MNEHECMYVSVRPDKRLFAVQHEGGVAESVLIGSIHSQ